MGNSSAKLASGEDVEVDLRQFNLLRCVGKGAFGKVRIVEKRDTRKLYALKYINKQQCVRMRAIQNIFRERAILEELSHPYIVNLRYAFQDDDNMFMVLDLMMGGDLRYHLDRIGGFREDAVRIMATELSSALNYLHKSKIVHRDLKPDNILLDEQGHVHLTDFNIAVKYVGRNALKSHSGTLAYMAPEIFGDSGYLWQVDWWSLGVCLYECLYGKRPFRGNSNEALTNAIRKQTLTLPDANYVTRQTVGLSNEGANFIRGLLDRNVERRLGSMGFESIRGHPWISGFDWERVERKDMNPLFVPEPNRSNFDASYDLEELLLEENPLKYKPRKKKPKADTAISSTNPAPSTPATQEAPTRNRFLPGRRKAASATSQNGTQPPVFDPRAMGRNRSAGGGLQANSSSIGGGGGFFNMLMSQPAGGASAHGNAAKDRVTAELQFIEENFKTYDFTLAAKAKRAAAVVAAAAAASAAAESHALTMDPASRPNLSSASSSSSLSEHIQRPASPSYPKHRPSNPNMNYLQKSTSNAALGGLPTPPGSPGFAFPARMAPGPGNAGVGMMHSPSAPASVNTAYVGGLQQQQHQQQAQQGYVSQGMQQQYSGQQPQQQQQQQQQQQPYGGGVPMGVQQQQQPVGVGTGRGNGMGWGRPE